MRGARFVGVVCGVALAGAVQASPIIVLDREYGADASAIDYTQGAFGFANVTTRLRAPGPVRSSGVPVAWTGDTREASVEVSALGDILADGATLESRSSNTYLGDSWSLPSTFLRAMVNNNAAFPLRGVFAVSALVQLPDAGSSQNVALSAALRINGALQPNFITSISRANGVFTRNGVTLPGASTVLLIDSYTFTLNAGDDFTASMNMFFDERNVLLSGGASSAYGFMNGRLSFEAIIPPGGPLIDPPTPPAAVPEPGTWAMLILGFGLVGMAARRRPSVGARRAS